MSRLSPLAPDLFAFGQQQSIMPGVRFPARSVVVRRPDGALIVHAPLSLDDALVAELDALGSVAFIVAPNSFHHLYVNDWHARYPEAEVHASGALDEKRPDLCPHHTLATSGVVFGALEAHTLEGMPKLQETVFFHAPSETLIVTDLFFNMRETEGALTGLVLRMAGARGRTAQSRMLRSMASDRPLAGRSCGALLELAKRCKLVVPAHGAPVDMTDEAQREALEAALAPMLAWAA